MSKTVKQVYLDLVFRMVGCSFSVSLACLPAALKIARYDQTAARVLDFSSCVAPLAA
jgi:hypothetical protein